MLCGFVYPIVFVVWDKQNFCKFWLLVNFKEMLLKRLPEKRNILKFKRLTFLASYFLVQSRILGVFYRPCLLMHEFTYPILQTYVLISLCSRTQITIFFPDIYLRNKIVNGSESIIRVRESCHSLLGIDWSHLFLAKETQNHKHALNFNRIQ